MKATCLALLAVLTGTAAAEDRVDPPGAANGEALRGNVLVWSDAAFFTEPSTTATAVHAARLAGDRKASAGEVVAMRVVAASKDGFVEVEPAADLDCAWSRFETTDDLQRVHVFVRRADLAPVLTEPFAKTFPDGSRIALRPGVAVVPTASGKFVLGVRGAEVVADLPATAVGHAYTPDRGKPVTAISDHEYEIAPKTHVTLGDQALVLAGSRAQTVERRGDTTLFSIQTRCVALDVVAPSRSVRAVDDDSEDGPEGGSAIGVLDLRDHDYIPPATMLSTPTGHPIAVAAKPLYLIAPPHGKTACVDRRVRITVRGGEALSPADDDDKLRVCAPASKVVHDRLSHR